VPNAGRGFERQAEFQLTGRNSPLALPVGEALVGGNNLLRRFDAGQHHAGQPGPDRRFDISVHVGSVDADEHVGGTLAGLTDGRRQRLAGGPNLRRRDTVLQIESDSIGVVGPGQSNQPGFGDGNNQIGASNQHGFLTLWEGNRLANRAGNYFGDY
jgi:hypothetical protein